MEYPAQVDWRAAYQARSRKTYKPASLTWGEALVTVPRFNLRDLFCTNKHVVVATRDGYTWVYTLATKERTLLPTGYQYQPYGNRLLRWSDDTLQLLTPEFEPGEVLDHKGETLLACVRGVRNLYFQCESYGTYLQVGVEGTLPVRRYLPVVRELLSLCDKLAWNQHLQDLTTGRFTPAPTPPLGYRLHGTITVENEDWPILTQDGRTFVCQYPDGTLSSLFTLEKQSRYLHLGYGLVASTAPGRMKSQGWMLRNIVTGTGAFLEVDAKGLASLNELRIHASWSGHTMVTTTLVDDRLVVRLLE